jgi:hypothetical protein
MESQQRSAVQPNSSEQVARPETLRKSPEAAALVEIGRAVRDDCRKDPKTYLDEVRVAAPGE